MRVGSVVFSTDQGLGILAKDFYDNGIVTNVVVLSHGRRLDHPEWYPNSPRLYSLQSQEANAAFERLIEAVDVMLFFETPFDWSLIDKCRAMGVKTALMPMYECMPKVLPATPDLFICPSKLDLQYYPNGVYIPVPVQQTWTYRSHAKTFVHNAGHGGLKGRNGTKELIEAIPMSTNTHVKFTIRCQDPNAFPSSIHRDPRVQLITGTQDYNSLFNNGDVFVFPEKFNGLSLPLQEAYASGMLVMATDRFPMNDWLPKEPLIPTMGHVQSEISPRCNSFQEAIVTPEDIARKIEEWAGKYIGDFSTMGRAWAEQTSWNVLKPVYLKTLEGML